MNHKEHTNIFRFEKNKHCAYALFWDGGRQFHACPEAQNCLAMGACLVKLDNFQSYKKQRFSLFKCKTQTFYL